MLNFDVFFNCVFLSIFTYHVLYFFVQYLVFKRIELLYYSMFLLSGSAYYFIFVASPLFHFGPFEHNGSFLSPFQLSFSFVQTYFYVIFILNYLDVEPSKKPIYKFFSFYKYYNLTFAILFYLLSFLNIELKGLFGFVSLIEIPLLLIALNFLRRLYSKYSDIVILGTTFTVIGTVTSLAIIISKEYYKIQIGFNESIPAQIGLLFDLFILGYGLSLKATESDRKLVQYLMENQQVVEGERSRLARDLHDGLGGILSGIKLNLASVKGSVVISEQDAHVFNRSMTQLDNAIVEMRRVAHNMMPETLLKLGLGEAVLDYCQTFNESNSVKLKFIQINFSEALEKPTEVILYRIIQELVNNSIKHAQANNVLIQLSRQQNTVHLVVEDDGIGFDVSQVVNKKGAGLLNVQSRVDYIKGKLTIESEKGKGTTTTIEITL